MPVMSQHNVLSGSSAAPPREWPTRLWQRIHMDFIGPFIKGNIYFIFVDAHSKWPEVLDMHSNTTTQCTIMVLRHIFALLAYFFN